jgi:hypothetical protein
MERRHKVSYADDGFAFVIEEKPHSVFRREGETIYARVLMWPLSML